METNPRNADGSSTRCPVKMLIGGYYQLSNSNSNFEEMKKWYHDVKNVIMQQSLRCCEFFMDCLFAIK